jgi:hypothetical protein
MHLECSAHEMRFSCQGIASPSVACAFAALGGVRRGQRAACLAGYRALPSRWRAGMAGERAQWGHGRGAGRHRWVGSREKWLYFSYTPSTGCARPVGC